MQTRFTALRAAPHTVSPSGASYTLHTWVAARRQVQEHTPDRERIRVVRDRMTRVQVSDETWAAYRVASGATPVSVALGQLVEREVASHRRRTALDADGVRDAVLEARAVAGELQHLISRLEQTTAHEPATH